MSLKRKHHEDPAEFNGNSSIDLSDETFGPSRKKSKAKKNVRFDDVTVYYFARSQSFVSVPSQGTVTLGMVPLHSHVEQYSVSDFSRLRRSLHKAILRERKLLPPSSSTTNDAESDTDEDEPLPVDDYYFVQPITTRQRRTLLKEAGLVRIDATEKQELTLIRRSRETCGCSCTRQLGGCQPTTCECYLNGIACQVDRLTFPCPCATMLCENPFGRLEFNQNRVRNHYFQTLTRLQAEKQQEELALSSTSDSDDNHHVQSIISDILSVIENEENQIVSLLNSMITSVQIILMENNESTSIGSSSIDEIQIHQT